MEQKPPLKQAALSVIHVFKTEQDYLDQMASIKDNEIALIETFNMYPVGSIYISTINVDPATLFGGKWQALNEGRVLIGANSSYPAGSKGGEASHRLTTSEMPSHSHGGSSYSSGSHQHDICWGNESKWGSPYGIYNSKNWHYGANTGGVSGTHALLTSSGGSHSHSIGSLSSAGGSSSHNNMMPYQSVYMWYRVS